MATSVEPHTWPWVEVEAEVAKELADVKVVAVVEVPLAPWNWKLKRPPLVLKLKQPPPLAPWNWKLKQPPSALSASAPVRRPSLRARRRAPCG